MGVWEDHTWHELNVRYPEEMYHFNRRADLWRVPRARDGAAGGGPVYPGAGARGPGP